MARWRKWSRLLQVVSLCAGILLVYAGGALPWLVARSDYRAARVCMGLHLDHSVLARLLGTSGGKVLAVVALLLWLAPWLFSVLCGTSLFGAFARGEAYRPATARAMRRLAWVVLSVAPVTVLPGPWFAQPVRWLWYVRVLPWLGVGFGLHVLASVLREGCRLQEEQDLVV